MINKRGSIFHWIVFGIVGAIGLFVYFALQAPALQTVKGTWQQGSLYDGFFPAELELLEQDVHLQHLFRDTAQELAENGGFQGESPCGVLEKRNFWKDECFPRILEEFQQLFVQRLGEKSPQYQFSELQRQGNFLVGKRIYSFQPSHLKKQPPSSVLQYSIPAGFSFDASPLADTYNSISSQAKELLQKCRNENEVTSCIAGELETLPQWGYASCGEKEELPAGERKLTFCVEGGTFQFQFALDFTPEKPLPVENFEVLYIPRENVYELRFPEDTFAESYNIYYTDFLEFVKTSGSTEEVFQQVLYGFKQEMLIAEVEERCPLEAERQKSTAYLCDGKVIYRIDDPRLTADDDYVFGVTTIRAGKESELLFLVKMEDLFPRRI